MKKVSDLLCNQVKHTTIGDLMLEILEQFVPQLNNDEKIELLEFLKASIAEEIGSSVRCDINACPRCGCPHFVKRGFDKSRCQRYLCKGCGQSFTLKTKGLLSLSKLAPKIWYDYAACMVDRLTLREAAYRCRVSLPTSWFMRHRLCEVMGAHLPTFRSAGRLQMDSIYFSENLSGNHNLSQSHPMPRLPHKSGKSIHKRGISNEKVCVICGINDFGDEFLELCCRGREGIKDVMSTTRPYLNRYSVVTTDDHTSYPKALDTLGVAAHHVVPSDFSKHSGGLGMINALHSRLRQFMSGFHGVASHLLKHYLDWFCYKDSFRATEGDKQELLAYHEAYGRYETTRRGYINSAHVIDGYWNISTVV